MAIDERYLTGLNSVYNKGALRNNVGRRVGRTSTISDAPMQGLTTPTEAEFYKGYGNTGKSYVQSPGYTQQPQQPIQTIVQQPTNLSTSGLVDDGSGNWYKSQADATKSADFLSPIGLGDTKDMPKSNWLDGMSNYETLQGAAGLGGLAMNAYGMFGSGGTMDVNKKNIELMNQQLANNREEMANRKGYRADIARTFGPKTGLGA